MLILLPTLAIPALRAGLSCRGAPCQNHDSGGDLASLPQMLDLARPNHPPSSPNEKGQWDGDGTEVGRGEQGRMLGAAGPAQHPVLHQHWFSQQNQTRP